MSDFEIYDNKTKMKYTVTQRSIIGFELNIKRMMLGGEINDKLSDTIRQLAIMTKLKEAFDSIEENREKIGMCIDENEVFTIRYDNVKFNNSYKMILEETRKSVDAFVYM